MHANFERADHLSVEVIAAAIEVHRALEIAPIHKAQVISYMKLMDIPLGLLINFNEVRLVDGVSRLLLPGSNR
jgi:hypothetical protein